MTSSSTTPAREELRRLLSGEAIMRGDFVLSSGRRSPYYIDARLVTLSGRGAPLVGEVVLEALRADKPDAVGGPTLGADPIVAAVIVASARSGRPLDGLLVRKQSKQHGGRRRIEGPWRDGMKVAVVEDTVTTGSSVLDAASALEEAGGHVSGIYLLIDREEGGREAIEAAGYRFNSIFTVSELLEPANPVNT